MYTILPYKQKDILIANHSRIHKRSQNNSMTPASFENKPVKPYLLIIIQVAGLFGAHVAFH